MKKRISNIIEATAATLIFFGCAWWWFAKAIEKITQ